MVTSLKIAPVKMVQRTYWLSPKSDKRGVVNRVFHNNVFFSDDLGALGISDHTHKVDSDFCWEFFGVIFIAA